MIHHITTDRTEIILECSSASPININVTTMYIHVAHKTLFSDHHFMDSLIKLDKQFKHAAHLMPLFSTQKGKGIYSQSEA